jgi:hypothetical protein
LRIRSKAPDPDEGVGLIYIRRHYLPEDPDLTVNGTIFHVVREDGN